MDFRKLLLPLISAFAAIMLLAALTPLNQAAAQGIDAVDAAEETPELDEIFDEEVTEDDLEDNQDAEEEGYVGYGVADPGNKGNDDGRPDGSGTSKQATTDPGNEPVVDSPSTIDAPTITADTFTTDEAAVRDSLDNGTGNLIVTVRTDLDSTNAGANTKALVLRSLPDGASSAATNLENLPVFIVPGSDAVLDILLANDLVAAVEADRLDEPHMDVVSDIINSDDLNAAGVRGNGWEGGWGSHAVAVLDTGVDNQHNAFAGRIISQACYAQGSPFGSGSCPNGAISQIGGSSGDNCPAAWGTACEHGTHVAGIAAGLDVGVGDDGVGPGLDIVAIQVFSDFGGGNVLSYTSDQLAGLNRVITLVNGGMDIAAVNMSLGGGQYFTAAACDAAQASRKTAIDALRAIDVLTVISAGNNGWTDSMGAPGCISTAVTVGATTDTNAFASYTNSAPWMDFWAPGGRGSGQGGTGVLAPIPTNPTAYGTKSGTSMAAPAVAGAIALLKECGYTTEWSAATIESRLHTFGTPLTRAATTTELIDVLAATETHNANDTLSNAEYLVANGTLKTDQDHTNCTTARDGAEPGEATIWYRIDPTATGTLTVETDATFDTELRIYNGPANVTSFGQLSFLGYDDQSGIGNNAKIVAPVNGTSYYYVQVDGWNLQNGQLDLNYRLGAAPTCLGQPATHVNDITTSVFYTGGNDVVVGNFLNNRIFTVGGNDLVCAFGGDDYIDGGDGVDVLYGQDNNDSVRGGTGVRRDFVYGGPGDDELRGQSGDDVMSGNAGNDDLYGGLGADKMIGGPGLDDMYGNDGDDRMYGSGDNDTMLGGNGVDRMFGQAGNDNMDGGAGDDDLRGGSGNDTMNGDDGVDKMFGQPGNDIMNGGLGNDIMFGWTGNDTMNGDNGNDTIYGQSQDDTLSGGAGVDTLIGASGVDRFNGGSGAPDSCNGGSGADIHLGGCEMLFSIP